MNSGESILQNQLLSLLPTSGDIRFQCECGERFKAGYLAIAHTFEGHEVVRERYSIGAWYYHDTLTGRSVAEMIWNRLRETGEEPERFIERIREMTRKKEEEMSAIEAAEREMGIR